MTYLVVLGGVVQGLFGPAITAYGQPAGLLFPPGHHRFTCRAEADWRASELRGAIVWPVAGERVA